MNPFPNQNMSVPGQMMQRPQMPQQQGPGGQNATQHIQSIIYREVTAQTGLLTGWQAQVPIQERIALIFSVTGNLRLASQGQPNPVDINRMIEIGVGFEKQIFDKSPDKDTYKRAVEEKLAQLHERRNLNQAGLQHTINQQAQAQAQAQQQAQAQLRMNQNVMQGQRPMPQQSQQQGFSHLQHQMQASPLPGQQPQQQPMPGMGNDSMPQNIGQINQQQFQMQQLAQQTQAQFNRTPGGPGQGPPNNNFLMEFAQRLYNQTSNEEKARLRTTMMEQMPPQALQNLQMSGQDPLIVYFRQQAMTRIRQDKQQRMAQAQQIAQAQKMAGGTPMQQRNSMNPSPMNGQPQPPVTMPGGNEFGGFMNNMDNIEAQRQQAVLAAGAGEVVVPANIAAQRNATPQPGGMSGGQMGMPVGNQSGLQKPLNRAQQQQQQQLMNTQQMQQQQQQQRIMAQQQSAQAQAMAARAKQQQMSGLQGQPGGMGNGPMPPQQSPALPTLNAPMRTPSQMSHQDASQVNSNPQMGQLSDPRFTRINNPMMGPGGGMAAPGINPQMFIGMTQEQQQRVIQLPPDRLQEVMAKFNAQRANAANLAGNMQMPQGGNAMNPGVQMPPGSQFNQPGNSMGMIGGRQPQINGANMTPTQQMVLQEQMQKIQHGNTQQRPGMPQNAQMEQHIMKTMDPCEFPPNFMNHAQFPRGVPPEIKKWGPLKAWASHNPNMGPENIEHIRHLQKLHWQSMMRARQQQQNGQAGNMQNRSQGTMPGMPMSAPTAPMTAQNPMQPGMMMPGAGPIRQPSDQDIVNARAHPSGKMATATNDQIRGFLIRQQHQNLASRQQQTQMLQSLQMQNQMNNQQPRPGQQIQPPNGRAPAQAPVQATQPKPTSGNSNSLGAANNAQVQNRAQQAPPNKRNTAQNSSPPQPQKSLKRVSSDDVIEITDPNIPRNVKIEGQKPQQQNQQSSSDVGSGPNQMIPPQNRQILTQQQIALLNPEARKEYERSLERAKNFMAEQKIKSIAKEEHQKVANEPLVDLMMSPEMVITTQASIKDILVPLSNMSRAMPRFFAIAPDEKRARNFFSLKSRVAAQFKDPEMTKFKDKVSISPSDIERFKALLNEMVKDLGQRVPGRMRRQLAQPNPPSPQPTASNSQAPVAGGPVELNAKNLEQHQQDLSKQQQDITRLHHRSNSRSHGPPAAPTQAQANFNFGAAKSPPDGGVIYGKNNNLTQEQLQLPAHKNKKQKQSNNAPGQNTPGSNVSPQVPKTHSPEIKRSTQSMPSFCCSELECDRHSVGFDTPDELKLHTHEEHVKPLSDPLQFVQKNLADILGLDAQGRLQKQPATKQEPNVAPSAPRMVASGSKQGQTPIIKSGNTPGASTPMNRQISMNRQASATGAKLATPSKGTSLKDGTGNIVGSQREATKPAPPQEVVVEDPWANTTIDPNDLFQAFQPFESGAGGAISNMDVYRSITPNDTPESSKDGISEPNSDISEGVALDINIDVFDDNWMPFANDMDFQDMGNYGNGIGQEDSTMMFDDGPPSQDFQWDDNADQSIFDKPFAMDTSLSSMYTE